MRRLAGGSLRRAIYQLELAELAESQGKFALSAALFNSAARLSMDAHEELEARAVEMRAHDEVSA